MTTTDSQAFTFHFRLARDLQECSGGSSPVRSRLLDRTNVSAISEPPYNALPAAQPKPMPAFLFVDDNWYIHLYPVGVHQAMQSLIDTVRPVVGQVRSHKCQKETSWGASPVTT